MTLTEIIEQQERWRIDIMVDMLSSWIDEDERGRFAIQLSFLNQSIGALRAILDTGSPQLFSSAISR